MATSFKKPKRNFRRKVHVDSESDEDQNGEKLEEAIEEEKIQHEQSIVLPKKVKKKKKDKETSASALVLSFGDEHEEGEMFKVKKSSHSKRIAKQLKKESQKKIDDEPAAVPDKPIPVKKEETREDRDEKIRKLREEFMTLNGDDAEAMDSDEEVEGRGSLSKMIKKGEIPDANMIHMIRKKRQLARDMGDFIPVDDVEKTENSKSRLVRDDDNDKSDEDDEEGRIDFTINVQARERIKMQNDFLAAEHGSDNEGSDQEREWEEQQIRKGVSMGSEVQSEVSQPAVPQSNQINGYQHTTEHMDRPVFQPFVPLTGETSQINMDIITKRLKERLDSMDEVHRSHMREQEKLTTDIEESVTAIETCEDSINGLEERYRFFQEMRGYVRDLVECLNEKVPHLNDLEQRMLNLWSNKAQKLVQRRQQDVRDQCQDYMTSNKQVKMETSEAHARQRRVAEREARRSRRRRARECRDIVGHHDGLSSDDEENQSEITKYNIEKDSIMSGMERLFEDVVEDFSQIDIVRKKFEEWKYRYGDTYREAYIGLCLPKLTNPLIRLHLIDWNPLEEKCRDFEESTWFESLVICGFRADDAIQIEDDDVKLLPSVVEKIIIPRLTVIAETIWDPLSTTQTSRLVNSIQNIINNYPTIHADNKTTQKLLQAVVKRMQTTLDDDVFMPLYPKSVTESRSSGSSIFFHRQSWTCIKLLGNILCWHGIVASKILQSLALDGLLNRYIILSLCNSVINKETLQKCQSIISTFPKEWFSDLPDDKTMPQLQNLSKYLLSAANTIYKELQNQKDNEKKDCREQIKQISKMLVNIHSMEHAISLSN